MRWYGMMYLLGFLAAYFVIRRLARYRGLPLSGEGLSDLLFYCVIGVILGGRLGYTLFYNLPYYSRHPAHILAVWEGGMSFHGGLLGVIVAALVFCLRRKLPVLLTGDILVTAAPIGLGLGRLGNFINGELWGRVTDVPWGMVFPGAGPLPRHPSQLYEAFLEGPVLFLILWLLHRRKAAAGVPFFSFFSLLRHFPLFRRVFPAARPPARFSLDGRNDGPAAFPADDPDRRGRPVSPPAGEKGMKNIRGVIFDCDGVLFESRQANLAYYNFILAHLGEPPVREDEPDKVHLCHTADSPRVFEGLLGPELSGEALKFAATLNYRRFIPFMIPEPGMDRALADLSARMPLAVATNRGSSMPEILRHFDLVPYFSAVVTSKDVPRPKPYPDMLLKAARTARPGDR